MSSFIPFLHILSLLLLSLFPIPSYHPILPISNAHNPLLAHRPLFIARKPTQNVLLPANMEYIAKKQRFKQPTTNGAPPFPFSGQTQTNTQITQKTFQDTESN